MNEKPKESKTSLGNGRIYGYAMGEFGYNFFITFVAYYLLYFLTNGALFSTAVAATLYTAARWIQWLSMPVAGVIVDRTQFKAGKYRPWLLIGSLLMCVAGGLVFTNLGLSSAAYVVVFLVLYALTYGGNSIMWVSYRALMGPMSKKSGDYVALSTAASQMGSLARIGFGYAAALFIGLYAATATPIRGYSIAAWVFGLLIVAGMAIVYLVTKPYQQIDVNLVAQEKAKKEKVSGKEMWQQLSSSHMLIFIITIVLRVLVIGLVPTLMVYYFGYVLQDPASMAIYLTITYLLQFLGASAVRWAANKWGKKPVFISTTFATAVLLVLTKFFGGTTVSFIILMSAVQFFNIFAASLVPAFIADIADYNEYKFGNRAKGFAYSVGGVCVNVAGVLGATVASFGLVLVGFDATVAPTAEVLNGITNLMTLASAVMMAIAACIFLAYKLNDKVMTQTREALAAAKSAEAAQDMAE